MIDVFYDMGGHVSFCLATCTVVARNVYVGSLVGATGGFVMVLKELKCPKIIVFNLNKNTPQL